MTLLSAPLALLAGQATAQTPPAAQKSAPAAKAPGDAPPKLEKLEEGEQPGITIRKPESERGTKETRDPSGRVIETQVKTGVSTYYVRPNNQVGNAQPGDLQSSGNRAAQFKVKEFDLGRKKPRAPVAEPQALEPAPPPPALPAKK